MKLLKEISAGSIGLSDEFEKLEGTYRLRKSARAIVVNAEGKMAVQYLNTYTYHKLPGGRVEQGETPEEAMKREVLEEVGCDCEISKDLGVTIEYRGDLIHISYAFAANVVGEIGETALEPGEIEEGQETLWLAPEEVLSRMEQDTPTDFNGPYILEREKAFLKEFLGNA